MAPKTTLADDKPVDTTAADVKARIKAITEDDAATGHEALAKYFAFDTDMPADEAIFALKVAAGDKPQANADDDVDPAQYEASRTAARDLAQPAPAAKPKAVATINTADIYARRKKGA